MNFYEWMEDLKNVARERYGFTDEAADSLDGESFWLYFENDYSPEEAMAEDMSYA